MRQGTGQSTMAFPCCSPMSLVVLIISHPGTRFTTFRIYLVSRSRRLPSFVSSSCFAHIANQSKSLVSFPHCWKFHAASNDQGCPYSRSIPQIHAEILLLVA
ncbi:hypothetical protein HBI56_083410 [Parastagonospora nodorum]|uniref:Uncharacterized protein n=1 Tax=Phaeosphaeria nodorum (strain SN15 / ATCC MYA-4574 / FGSC 10173) TaxID=321614 RepID=A0A7U2FK30_PHANO|nr:hypothetical protein HBH56_103150 [Parastagonospora nodorum]QRD04586.1 hypothetical protein JI435_443680 [Parastagonospora nodorum SN15]KAH3929619.1 hypothetical protein HBH54_127250 [Parastagonospora nodorum]KAH3951676.1 hypothetical protein HBH53_061270 [Parastagonospora nodorum]KAH3975446.1 hypothetical protein HBH52_125570 [Parastagonospora nodorum]